MWCGTSRWQARGGVSRTTRHEQEVRASHVREQDGENERDYEVGRGKPPVHSGFKNGQSANPRGPRPRNLALPVEALNDKVVITMDGERREISKCEAVPAAGQQIGQCGSPRDQNADRWSSGCAPGPR
jgi:hypothetical protein